MLNENQQKAVRIPSGRILVLAGAGSGKTKVLTQRIAHLINDLNQNPSSILALTFTNKAAREMKERLNNLIGKKKAQNVILSTFHSFCLKILRKEAEKIGYNLNFSIYDEKDVQRLLSLQLKEQKNIDFSPTKAFEIISSIKNKNTPLDEYSYENDDEKDVISDIYPKLSSSLKAYNAMDLDSLLSETLNLFKQKDILEKYQNQYKHLLIDEYQDTNKVQYLIAEALSQKSNNLFVVGDDDQSIYGFRGSVIDNILKFKADHTIKLEQNYRSTKTILNAANSLIKNNKKRHDKTLFSKTLFDEKIKLFHAPTEIDESQAIINKIIDLRKTNNLKWKDIAILYRSNSLSRNVEVALINATWRKDNNWIRSIPYNIYGGLEFSKRAEIKDIFAYLRFIINPKDLEALYRIINVPRRSISSKTLEALSNYNKETKIPIWEILKKIHLGDITDLSLQPKIIASIKNFVAIIQEAKSRFDKNSLSKSLKWLIDEINYKKAIEEEVKSEKARQVKWENTLECLNAISIYEESETNPTLKDFLSTSMLLKENISKNQNSKDDKVQLMTFHSSKGLEFEAVFLIGLEDHIIPHEKSIMQTSTEEERRLLYVAMTRAKKHLTLSMCRSRKRAAKSRPTNPSRFLFEIPKEYIELTSFRN